MDTVMSRQEMGYRSLNPPATDRGVTPGLTGFDVLDLGCDYLRMTSTDTGFTEFTSDWESHAYSYGVSKDYRPMKLRDFRAWQSWGVKYGYRDEPSAGRTVVRHIIEASGVAARFIFQQYREMYDAMLSVNYPRVDIQMTLLHDEWVDYDAVFEQAKITGLKHKIIKSDEGSTVYAGSRMSQRYIRIYDKTKEYRLSHVDTTYGKYATRFEIEYKDDLACRVAEYLCTSGTYTKVIRGETERLVEKGMKVLVPFGLMARRINDGLPFIPKLVRKQNRDMEYLYKHILPWLENAHERLSREHWQELHNAVQQKLFDIEPLTVYNTFQD